MYGSVYKYRLPPTYGPSLKSQEKWQLVSVAHSAGTQVQPAGRNTVLSVVFCNLLPNRCFLHRRKRNKRCMRVMLIALFSPPLINRQISRNKSKQIRGLKTAIYDYCSIFIYTSIADCKHFTFTTHTKQPVWFCSQFSLNTQPSCI